MKLYIQQRVLTLLDSFDIYDGDRCKKYTVKSEFLSLGTRLHVFDLSGREVGLVKQKLLSFIPTYEIEVGGLRLGEIKKQFNLLRNNFDVNYFGLRVEGNFFGWNYYVYQDENVVMTINKEVISWGDAYVIEYNDPDIELYGLMLVLAIDSALFSGKKNHLWD